MLLDITDSVENFDFWRQREYLNDATRQLLENVDVLIVPEEGFRDYSTPLFPSNMIELYDVLKAHMNVEAVINDEDYREVSLNSKLHRYGKFAVLSVAVPVFVSVLSNFISDKLKYAESADEIEFEILLQDTSGKVKSIKYKGSADGLKSAGGKIIQMAKDDGEHKH